MSVQSSVIQQPPSAGSASRQSLIQALAEQMRQYGTARRHSAWGTISSGYPVLDRSLPGGGLERGTLVEWLAHEEGSGATTLAMKAAKEACGQAGSLVVVDRMRTFYPLAAAACGVDLSRVILVRVQNERDETWAIDQALRSRGASAVVAWPEKLDDHLFRRLQLAAETGETLGLFIRPGRAIAEASWAEVRLLVEPLPSKPSSTSGASRRVRLTLLRAPGRTLGNADRLVLDLYDGSKQEFEPQRTQRTQRGARRIA
jgi:protein ImuA